MKRLTKQEEKFRHLSNLSAIIGQTYGETKHTFKLLKVIEGNGHRMAVAYCNGEIDSEQWFKFIDELRPKMAKLLPLNVLRNIHFNGDARGYFLKLNDDFVRENKLAIHTDWGGYGIFCPEGI